MKGHITIESREDFDSWIEKKYAEQESTQPVAEPSDAVAIAD
jgi:heme/copper-type cytochrome/quinol oxidase subunit 2